MTKEQLTNAACGANLQPIVAQAIQENNSVLTGCNVHWLFRGSFISLETGKHGIRWLILRILAEAGKNQGLTTEDIINVVRSVNGFDKYTNKTILHNLSHVLTESKEVASKQLTSEEDCDRNSEELQLARITRGQKPIARKPRKLWFLA